MPGLRDAAEAELAHIRILRDMRRHEHRVARVPVLATALRAELDELVVPALRSAHPVRAGAAVLELRDREHVARHPATRPATRVATRPTTVHDDELLVAAHPATRPAATRVATRPTTTVRCGVHGVPAHAPTRPAPTAVPTRPTTTIRRRVHGRVAAHAPTRVAARPATAVARAAATRVAARPATVRRESRHATLVATLLAPAVARSHRVAAARAATHRGAARETTDAARDRVRHDRRAPRAAQWKTADAGDGRHEAAGQVLVDVLAARETDLAAVEEPALAHAATARSPAAAPSATALARVPLARPRRLASRRRALRLRPLARPSRSAPPARAGRCLLLRVALARPSRLLGRQVTSASPHVSVALPRRRAPPAPRATGGHERHPARSRALGHGARPGTTAAGTTARGDAASSREHRLGARVALVVRSHRATQGSDVVRHSASPRRWILEQSLGDRSCQDRSVLVSRIEAGSAASLAGIRVLVFPSLRATERSIRRAHVDVPLPAADPLIRILLRGAAGVYHRQCVDPGIRAQPTIRLHAGRSLVPASRVLGTSLVDQSH